MCLMHTDLPVPDGPRIIEILPSGRPMFRPRRILLRPKALWTSTNSTASGAPVGRLRPVCHWYSSSSRRRRPARLAHDGHARRRPRSCSRVGRVVGVGRRRARSAPVVGRRSARRPSSRRGRRSGSRSSPSSSRLVVASRAMRHPPIGARGFAPQKSCVPSIPMRCTSTMFSTIDFAVAVPTPTGPPPRVVAVVAADEHDDGRHHHALDHAVEEVGWVLEHPEDEEEAAAGDLADLLDHREVGGEEAGADRRRCR